MRRSIAQYLDGVKTETASWQEAEEFDELKKIKFEGKLERSLELLKQFLEYGEAQEKELREKEDSLNKETSGDFCFGSCGIDSAICCGACNSELV